MAIDDKVAKAIENLAQESSLGVRTEVFTAAFAGIPWAGSPITSLLAGRAHRRVIERAVEMANAMKERLDKVDESKVDKGFFETEEFQTLLFLAFEQLRSTHDRAKLRMLANGLANSALREFSPESRKELFIRILRDLSPEHIHMLTALVPSERKRNLPSIAWPEIRGPKGEHLAILQNLAADGLVEEFLVSGRTIPSPRSGGEWTASDVNRAIRDIVGAVPSRNFRLSNFGLDFLRYLGEATRSDATGSPASIPHPPT